jgi:hypothetical protein
MRGGAFIILAGDDFVFAKDKTLHMLHCTEVSQQPDAMGHVWTAPAVQEGI